MLSTIAFYQIFGLTVASLFGILALLLFLFTGLVGMLNKKGINKIPFKWHHRASTTAIVSARRSSKRSAPTR